MMWPAAFAQSHGATSSAIKAVVRAFPYERNLVEELGNEHLPLSRRNCIRSAPARIVHTLSIGPREAELPQVPSPSTEAYREAGCVGSSGEDCGRLLEKLSEQMSIIEQLQIPITEQSQIPQNYDALTDPIGIDHEADIIRSAWTTLRCTRDTLVTLADNHVQFWRPRVIPPSRAYYGFTKTR
jgi:hypothetical protein